MHLTELDFHLNATTSLDKSFRITSFIYKMGILLLTLLGCCKKEEDDACKVLHSTAGTGALNSEYLSLILISL